MNSSDREWLQGRFDRIDDKLTEQSEVMINQGKAIARLETKWKMVSKAAAMIAAATSISITSAISFFKGG